MTRPMARVLPVGAMAVALVAFDPAALRSEPITREGITFSDELGGFEIHALTGTGRLDDPFVLVEEVTGDGEAVLVVRGLRTEFGNRVDTQHATGFALQKVVINSTGRSWSNYEIELREHRSASSPYEDGLSFGQASDRPPENSDRFGSVANVDEPYDGLSFADGAVAPGLSATFTMIVTDETPQPSFLVVQHALLVVADARMPGEGLAMPDADRYADRIFDFTGGDTTP